MKVNPELQADAFSFLPNTAQNWPAHPAPQKAYAFNNMRASLRLTIMLRDADKVRDPATGLIDYHIRCAYCNVLYTEAVMTIDHVVSDRENRNSPRNLVSCCWQCNTTKGFSKIEKGRNTGITKLADALSLSYEELEARVKARQKRAYKNLRKTALALCKRPPVWLQWMRNQASGNYHSCRARYNTEMFTCAGHPVREVRCPGCTELCPPCLTHGAYERKEKYEGEW